MIDEKVLIERLEKLENKWRYIFFKEREQNGKTFASEYADGKRYGITEIIKIVKKLAEEHNNGWIYCEKELPEECKTVLGCDTDGCCELVYFYKCPFLGEHWRVHRGGYRPLENIIAWQPLPERPAPYKKGE